MSNARRRAVFGVLLVILGAAAFLIASAYIVDRGYSKVLAGIVGALAFPVLPVAWHVWGERRRARKRADAKKPAKSSLTGADRYWFRFGIVALAVLGPMIYVGHTEVLGAAVRHATWFIPDPVPGIGGLGLGHQREFPDQESLLRRVPSDAEAVVVVHDPAGPDVVAAYGGRQAFGVGRPTFPRGSYDQWAKLVTHFLPAAQQLEALAVVPNTDDLEVQASDGWRGKVEPPAGALPPEIRGELARASDDADIAVGFAPHTQPVAKYVRRAALWVHSLDASSYELDVRIEARDIAAASQILAGVRDALAGHPPTGTGSACSAALAKLDDSDVGLIGVSVIARVRLSKSALADLGPSCTP